MMVVGGNMTELPAILYPVTYPKRHVLYYLSLLFDKIHLLLPSEKDSMEVPKTMCDMELCPVVPHVPVPLGEKREWFQSMLRDWQQWAAQIGLGREGTDASFVEAASYAMEESLQSIIDSIKGSEKEDEDLQARIFLELALELDMREDELFADLHDFSSRQEELKSFLAGPTGFGRQGSRGATTPVEPIPQGRKRLSSWARLYAKWNALDLCPVGEGINIKDYMDQAYESLKRQPATDILSLDLSFCAGEKSQAHPEVRALISELLEKVCAGSTPEGNENIDELCQSIRGLWGHAEQAHGPRLVLTAYPGVEWKMLLSIAAHLDSPARQKEGVCGYSFYLV